MREECLNKLREYFGSEEFTYTILHSANEECVFATISESVKENTKNIGIYRVRKAENNFEVRRDLAYMVNMQSNASILGMIEDVVKTCGRIKESSK